MLIFNDSSSTRPADLLIGPSATLKNINVTHDGDLYHYTTYHFFGLEYDFIKRGILPAGAVWDDVLRGIERSALYDLADLMLAKLSSDCYDEKKWQEWVEYKRKVRATPHQAGYPATVQYPEKPE